MKTQLCPLCSLLYPDAGGLLIGCDGCDAWFDIKCTEDSIPECYYCRKFVNS